MTHGLTEKVGKTGGRKREKWVKFRVTTDELGAVRAAAERARLNVSQFASRLVLDEALGTGRARDANAIYAVRNFRELFTEAMRLSLQGKLTAQRFEGLAGKLGDRE